jgi:AcrR family transcriptional regulator
VSTTRARILEAAGELFARQGYVGTGMNQIVSEGGAALGSIYHFFPGDKAQLCAESIRNYADACPIANIALEVASTDEELRQATAEVFCSWVTAAARHLERGGVPASEAATLATFALAALEGAFILCRAHRSTDAIVSAAAYVQRAVQDAVSPAGRSDAGTTAPLRDRFPRHRGEQADA